METLKESYKHKLGPKMVTQLITTRGESNLILSRRTEYFIKYTKEGGTERHMASHN